LAAPVRAPAAVPVATESPDSPVRSLETPPAGPSALVDGQFSGIFIEHHHSGGDNLHFVMALVICESRICLATVGTKMATSTATTASTTAISIKVNPSLFLILLLQTFHLFDQSRPFYLQHSGGLLLVPLCLLQTVQNQSFLDVPNQLRQGEPFGFEQFGVNGLLVFRLRLGCRDFLGNVTGMKTITSGFKTTILSMIFSSCLTFPGSGTVEKGGLHPKIFFSGGSNTSCTPTR
jgi:hypothetical protein